jgi:hypothetical protein
VQGGKIFSAFVDDASLAKGRDRVKETAQPRLLYLRGAQHSHHPIRAPVECARIKSGLKLRRDRGVGGTLAIAYTGYLINTTNCLYIESLRRLLLLPHFFRYSHDILIFVFRYFLESHC